MNLIFFIFQMSNTVTMQILLIVVVVWGVVVVVIVIVVDAAFVVVEDVVVIVVVLHFNVYALHNLYDLIFTLHYSQWQQSQHKREFRIIKFQTNLDSLIKLGQSICQCKFMKYSCAILLSMKEKQTMNVTLLTKFSDDQHWSTPFSPLTLLQKYLMICFITACSSKAASLF